MTTDIFDLDKQPLQIAFYDVSVSDNQQIGWLFAKALDIPFLAKHGLSMALSGERRAGKTTLCESFSQTLLRNGNVLASHAEHQWAGVPGWSVWFDDKCAVTRIDQGQRSKNEACPPESIMRDLSYCLIEHPNEKEKKEAILELSLLRGDDHSIISLTCKNELLGNRMRSIASAKHIAFKIL